MDEFKSAVIVSQIGGSILSRRCISDSWGCPDFVRNNDSILRSVLGDEGHDLYLTMSSEDKNAAIAWFEGSGKEINELAGTTSWEEAEDGGGYNINLVEFAARNPALYPRVVKFVCDRAYESLPAEMQEIIVKKFTEEPIHFQNENERNR